MNAADIFRYVIAAVIAVAYLAGLVILARAGWRDGKKK